MQFAFSDGIKTTISTRQENYIDAIAVADKIQIALNGGDVGNGRRGPLSQSHRKNLRTAYRRRVSKALSEFEAKAASAISQSGVT